MGFIFDCTAQELAEAVAEEQGKDKSKVHKDTRGGWFTYDPVITEKTPSCSIDFANDGKLLVKRFPELKGDPNNIQRVKLITELAIKKGYCRQTIDGGASIARIMQGKVEELKRKQLQSLQKVYKAGDMFTPQDSKRGFEVEAAYNYNLESGKLAYQRLSLKGRDEMPYNHPLRTKGDRLLYNQDKLFEARKAQEVVLDDASYKSLGYKKEALLDEMRGLKQWLFWKHLKAADKKLPCDENREALTGWNEPSKWKAFEDLFEKTSFGAPLKKGFFFTKEDPFVFIDFDDVLQVGEIPTSYKLSYEQEPITAQDIEGYYVETSNSGTGYHIIVKLKDASLKSKLIPRPSNKDTGFEFYLSGWCACTCKEVDEFNLELIEGTLKPQRVYITGSEKDADTLTSKGLLATTCGKALSSERGSIWQSQYTKTLKDFDCVVLANNTLEGLMLGSTIAGKLFNAKQCTGLKLVTISKEEAPNRGDITEYLEQHSLDDLLIKIENVSEYTPSNEDLLPIEDKIPIDVELETLSFDMTGNAKRVLDYTGGIFRWVDDGGEKQAFVYDTRKGAWIQSFDKAVALAQIALRRIPEEIIEKHKGLDEKGSEIARKWARASQSPKAAKDALETTYSLSGSTLLASDFDLHPKQNNGRCFINCKNGTVDLCTGELLEHSKDRHITQYCDREYNPNLTSPLWEKCLLDIFEGDQSLVDNFQIHIGYAAMGYPKEKAFFVFHGDAGDTGKSTVLETLKNVLGVDYAGEIPFSTIQINEHSEAGKPDSFLSKVKKAHVVTISETETREGKRAALNFEKVKTLSGADSIPIRDLYKPATSFLPMFTLMIALNNKPRIGDIKSSTWDRMRLFPFVHKFEGKEKDPNMGSKLLAEADGIFNWIVQGAIQYTREGTLPKHPKVVEAVREYRIEENPLEGWLADCAIIGRGFTESRKDIQESITNWFAGDDIRESMQEPSSKLVTAFLRARGVKYEHNLRKAQGIQLTQKGRMQLEKARQEAQETLLPNNYI